MGTELRPIETRYKGYRFRSRLEARWAVFFDAMQWTWEYEPEGYGDGSLGYLPDFLVHVPLPNCAAERLDAIDEKFPFASHDEKDRLLNQKYEILRELQADLRARRESRIDPREYFETFVEIKPANAIDAPGITDKATRLAKATGRTVTMVFGMPGEEACLVVAADEIVSARFAGRRAVASAKTRRAIDAARAARFEFGESGHG